MRATGFQMIYIHRVDCPLPPPPPIGRDSYGTLMQGGETLVRS